MFIDRWLLVLIVVLLACDIYYTRKWLIQSQRELRKTMAVARAAGIMDDDGDEEDA